MSGRIPASGRQQERLQERISSSLCPSSFARSTMIDGSYDAHEAGIVMITTLIAQLQAKKRGVSTQSRSVLSRIPAILLQEISGCFFYESHCFMSLSFKHQMLFCRLKSSIHPDSVVLWISGRSPHPTDKKNLPPHLYVSISILKKPHFIKCSEQL